MRDGLEPAMDQRRDRYWRYHRPDSSLATDREHLPPGLHLEATS